MSIGYQFVIMGPQGSGKGTQAKLLADRFNLKHISTGEIFRQAVIEGGVLGQKVKEVIDQGQLMPDEITNNLVADKIKISQDFILDGYPRNLAQAQFLAKLVPGIKVINLQLSDEEAIKRIAGRRICPNCGAVYHLVYQPPIQPGICDRCGGRLQQRADDMPEAIKRRLDTYHRQTEPLLDYYDSRKQLITIDGSPSIEEVEKSIVESLKL